MEHIHSSTSCHTLRPTTKIGWLPELSGLTESDAVDEWGEILCSHCFPSAPVAWTIGVNKKDAAAKELAAALKTIERSPEGKKVKSGRALVERKRYTIESLERELARAAEDRAAGREPPAWLTAELPAKEARLAKTRKELRRAHVKLAAAEAALDAALAG